MAAQQTAGPVEVVGGDIARRVGQVLRRRVHVGVEGHHRVEGVGRKGQPLHGAEVLRYVGAHLQQCHKVVAVHADGTVDAPLGSRGRIGVIRRALIMARQHVLYVLGRDLFLGHHAPGQVVGARRKVSVRAVPGERIGVEITQHVPAAGRVVDMVGIVVAAEGVARDSAHRPGTGQDGTCR